ncbi:DnaD domain protein [uncultured Limosilactobacillus sp.]|uniref:DnaD domain protein n=1 Tax=uncultured Limosilactobacillus sp. TaxID=2837629 RepID=UPI0025E8679E|nr:DnaD domain protein [uncultured Limosilactobacillus sp.]
MGKRTITNDNRSFNGVWIPKKYWLDENLTPMELLFMAEIESLDGENGCYASNNHFAQFFGISASRVSQVINGLKEKGYLTIAYNKQGKQVLNRIIRVVNKLSEGSKNTKTPIKNIKGGYLENAKGSNTPRVIQESNTRESSSAPTRNDAFRLAQELQINVQSATHSSIFINYISRLGADFVCYALNQASKADRPSWNYLIAILNRLERDGIKTVQQAEEQDAKRRQQNQQRYRRKKQGTIKEPLPDWFKKQYMQDKGQPKEGQPAPLTDGTIPPEPNVWR